MKKKLQVFISSTYTDLIEERQAAVEAVLNAGHIPAGMELFKSADQSQKEIIKNWIEESDVYMLILGGRYGSIDDETGLSYTHWEYNYAGELGKRRFSIVIDSDYLKAKVKERGEEVIELENRPLYDEFKKDVLTKMSKFYADLKDIKITVLESIKEIEKDESLTGWVSGQDYRELSEYKEKYLSLKEEYLNQKQQFLTNQPIQSQEKYDKTRRRLEELTVDLSNIYSSLGKRGEADFHQVFLSMADNFALGYQTRDTMSFEERYFTGNVIPKLVLNGLVENVNLPDSHQRFLLTSYGKEYLEIYN